LYCYFAKEQICLAPYFSKREAKLVDKKKLKKTSANFFQAKVVKSIKKKGFFVCPFLDEVKYRCLIYKKRPIDCVIWPFIIGWDKEKQDVYLWIANSSVCPAVGNRKVRIFNVIDRIVSYLKKKESFEEIKNGERYLWPYKNYQIKLKNLTKCFLRNPFLD